MIYRLLSALLPRVSRPDVVYECRHCGSAVPEDADACPECGADEIAAYRLP